MGDSPAAPQGATKLGVVGLSLTRSSASSDGGLSEREVLRDVTFSVGEGEVFGVIGPSGAGKTTLLRLLNGLETADRGSIALDGMDIVGLEMTDLRRRVGMVFQAPALFHGTVGTNVGYALELDGVPRGEREGRGAACLERAGLPPSFWGRDARELSQGEQQRVAIARALAADPEVLLLDEPTSALDPAAASRIVSLVGGLNEEVGVTIVFVTHLMEQARQICDRALVLIGGEGVEEGTIPELFDCPSCDATRLFIQGRLDPHGLVGDAVREASAEAGGGR
jgi:ABC-type methionine transport system ATPase subunit